MSGTESNDDDIVLSNTNLPDFNYDCLDNDIINLLIKRGLDHVVETIFSYLDADSLDKAEDISFNWGLCIQRAKLWKIYTDRKVKNSKLWQKLLNKQGWIEYILRNQSTQRDPDFYKMLYSKIVADIEKLTYNWSNCKYRFKRYRFNFNYNTITAMYFFGEMLIFGFIDGSLQIFSRDIYKRTHYFQKHSDKVTCIQCNDKVLVSGGADKTIRLWDLDTNEALRVLYYHEEVIEKLRFQDGVLISCSQDKKLAIWDMSNYSNVKLKHIFVALAAFPTHIDFNDKYIVSSVENSIIVWKLEYYKFLRTLTGHNDSVTCLAIYEESLITGSQDKTIRLWAIDSGECIRVMEIHHTPLYHISVCSNMIVSGSSDGELIVWSKEKAFDNDVPLNNATVTTLQHENSMFYCNHDEFEIVIGAKNGVFYVWDFLNTFS